MVFQHEILLCRIMGINKVEIEKFEFKSTETVIKSAPQCISMALFVWNRNCLVAGIPIPGSIR